MPTDAGAEPEPKRDLRDRPLVRVAMLLGVLLIAAFAAKTCASRDTEIDSDEATEIAREAVDYEPEQVMVRFVPRGAQSRPYWAVSLSTTNAAGIRVDCATVLVDGNTGAAETKSC